jgi:hypothetical protein
LVRDGDDRDPGAVRDGLSSVTVYTRDFCRAGVDRAGNCYDRNMAALTTTQLGAVTGSTVIIDEADIEINAAAFSFARDPSSDPRALDLQAVLVHEIGHALGFADNCRARSSSARTDHRGRPLPDCRKAPADVLRSVMFPAAKLDDTGKSRNGKRTLSRDDIAGVCASYPSTAKPAND